MVTKVSILSSPLGGAFLKLPMFQVAFCVSTCEVLFGFECCQHFFKVKTSGDLTKTVLLKCPQFSRF